MYKIKTFITENGHHSITIVKEYGSRIMYIPTDPANTDYQEYLEWLAEGNEPLPADESL